MSFRIGGREIGYLFILLIFLKGGQSENIYNYYIILIKIILYCVRHLLLSGEYTICDYIIY